MSSKYYKNLYTQMTPTLESRIIDMARNGGNASSIKKDLADEGMIVSIHKIRSLISSHKIKTTNQKNAANSYRMIAMLQEGVSNADVAREFNCSRQYIHTMKKQFISCGLKFPSVDQKGG